MEKKVLFKIVVISAGILLFGWLMVNIALSSEPELPQDPILNGLTEVHNQLLKTEVQLSKTKTEHQKLETELEVLRADRDVLNAKVDEIINAPLNTPEIEQKEASFQ